VSFLPDPEAAGFKYVSRYLAGFGSSYLATPLFSKLFLLIIRRPVSDGAERLIGATVLTNSTAVVEALLSATERTLAPFGMGFAISKPSEHPATTPGLSNFDSFDVNFTMYFKGSEFPAQLNTEVCRNRLPHVERVSLPLCQACCSFLCPSVGLSVRIDQAA
jgi:hypothetical protein